MAKETGIKWTDSTHSPWFGCTKIENNLACMHCYAEGVDKRSGGDHWGRGKPRRLNSEKYRNEPIRWNRAHDKFFAEHGRKRRVFTLSMGDLFDNEVPAQWRSDHMGMMEATPNLEWQICTKRVSNIPKMIFPVWEERWPQNIGVLITVVTQAEADRDIPRLLKMKQMYSIPWVGISYEPAQEMVYMVPWMGDGGLDWIIFGGKSGGQWNDRPFDISWAYGTAAGCYTKGTAFFMKQVAAFRPTDDMIPPDLMIRQWPKGH